MKALGSRKILFINNLSSGGAERQASLLASTPFCNELILIDNQIHYEVAAEKVITLFDNFFKGRSSLEKILSLPQVIRKLGSRINQKDHVISFLELANFLNIILSFFTGHRCYVSVRTIISNQYSKGLKSFLVKNLVRILYPKADSIICNSQGGRDDLIRNFGFSPDKVIVIPNMIDLKKIEMLRKEIPPTGIEWQSRTNLMNISRFVHGKGHRFLIDVFASVLNHKKDVRLVLIGEGPLEDNMRSYAQNKGLKISGSEADVIFLGKQKNVFSLLSQASLFVFPTEWEGLPNTLIEALTCGCPVISSDAPFGPREVLCPTLGIADPISFPFEGEGGYLLPNSFKETNQEAWVQLILSTLNDEKKRKVLEEKAMKRVKDFDITSIRNRWASFLGELS